MLRRFLVPGAVLVPVALAALLLLARPPAARASGCYPSYGYGYSAPSYSYSSYSYSYPTYPTYSYSQPAYSPQPYYPPPSYYQPPSYAAKAYTTPDYFFSVQDYYKDKLLVDAMAGRTTALLAQLQVLQGGGPAGANQASYGGYTYYGMAPGRNYQQQPPQQPQQQPPAGAERGGPPRNPSSPPASGTDQKPGEAPKRAPRPADRPAVTPPADKKLVADVGESCLQCHNGSDPRRMNLTDLASLDYYERCAVVVELASHRMPKNSDDHWQGERLQRVQEWTNQARLTARK